MFNNATNGYSLADIAAATNHKLNWESVEYIRKHSEISSTELGRKFGVSRTTINDVKEYRTWKVKNDLNS